MAKKDAVDAVDTVDAEDKEVIAKARSTTGRTPHEVLVIMREFSKMLESVRMSKANKCFIGTYFVPMEGQPGIEGLVNAGAELINGVIAKGWQPWNMGTPYFGKYAFRLPNGQTTGMLDGQWITIVFLRPEEELQ